ncbi:MAG: flagellar basal body P-ring formation chaperone FlgA [Pseudomonadota bacterium]
MRAASTLCLVIALASAGPGAAASLRGNVVVDADIVRLGDLFDDPGPRGHVAVARAPAPGRREAYEIDRLLDIARTHRVAWQPQSRFDRVVVERGGRTIGTAEILASLRAALGEAGKRRGAQIELAGRDMEIAVALDAPPSIELRNLALDPASGRFAALLVAGGNHPSAQRVAISGRVFHTLPVPVLRRTVGPGEVIRREDIQWIDMREDQARRDILTDPARLVGTTPRQRLRAGEPVRENDTRPPIVVAKNSTVTIVLESGNMSLTTQGQAVEDGAKGDTIRVVSKQSKKTIEAVVAGPGQVSVPTSNRPLVN